MDWQILFFDGWTGVWRILLIAGFAYAGLILLLRVSGKRSLSKLNMFDFVVTVALGSVLASILLTKDVDWAEGMTAVLMLVALQWVVSFLSVRSSFMRRAVRSDPRMLVEHGEYLDDAMRKERVTRDEIDAVIRKKGFGDPSQVAWVVLESDGSFSVIGADQAGEGGAMGSVLNHRGGRDARG